METVKKYIWVLKPSWEEEEEEPGMQPQPQPQPRTRKRKRKGKGKGKGGGEDEEVVNAEKVDVPEYGGGLCFDSTGLVLTTISAVITTTTPKLKNVENVLKKLTVRARSFGGFFREAVYLNSDQELGLVVYQITKRREDEVFGFLDLDEVNDVELPLLDKVFSFVQSGGNYSFRRAITNFPGSRIFKDILDTDEFPYLKANLPLIQVSNLGEFMSSGMSGCPVFNMGGIQFLGLITFCSGQFTLVIPYSNILEVLPNIRKKKDDENTDKKMKKGGDGGGKGGGVGDGGGEGGGGGRGGFGDGRGGSGGRREKGGGARGRGGRGERGGKGRGRRVRGGGGGGGGISGFSNDGWTLLNCDGAEDTIITCNSAKPFMATLNGANSLPVVGGVLCAKASMLLEDNPITRTLDLTSSPEVGPPTNQGASDATYFGSTHSALTIVLQLPFESNLPESVATMARHYVSGVISSVQRVDIAISPSDSVDPKLSPGSPEALILVHWICTSYSCPGKAFYRKTQTGGWCNSFMALHYGKQIAKETSREVVYGLGRQPALLQRRSNDVIDGFSNDGWTLLNCDGAEDVIIACNAAKPFIATLNGDNLLPVVVVLCGKASMLLQNVPPTVLVRLLREHRSEWADVSVDAYSAAALKANSYAFPGMRATRFSGSQIIMPLDHTIEHEKDNLTNRTIDFTLGREVGPPTNQGALDATTSGRTRSVLTITFHLPFESNLQEIVATMAHQYVRSVISSVQNVAMAITPSGLTPTVGPKLSLVSLEALTLVHWICKIYCCHMGIELLQTSSAID